MRRSAWRVLIAGSAAAAIGGAGWGLTRFAIAEGSMAPTLRDGDWVLARRLCRRPRRGDVVIFAHPHRDGFFLVKRVVALPGETVTIVRGAVLVDGEPQIEPWATGPTTPGGSWAVGPGQVFVLGDNRPASADDSRTHGPIARDAVGWRLLGRYWPPR